MNRPLFRLLGLLLLLFVDHAAAQMMRPPAFAGGIPGRAQMDAIFLQRHQARTLLYREALAELRQNPQAADLPDCRAGQAGPCLATDAKPPAGGASAQGGRRIALLFGNNDYAKPIPPLETPIADVDRIAELLTGRFGFSTRVVRNAGQLKIVEELNRIAATVQPEDSVLLFYAGHGYLMEDIAMGFWIPVDASVKTAKGWISNQDIAKMLAAIPARQLILISDSCFSGTLTKEQKVADHSDGSRDDLAGRRSVVVLSSGGDEPVSDEGKDGHSIFAWNLIRELQGMAGVTPGVRIWRTLRSEVSREYPQEPQYGAVLSAGHVSGGDYLFRPQ